MSEECNTSGILATLLSLDFKLMNNFKENTENASAVNVSIHTLHNTTFSPYLSNSITIDHAQF